MTQLILVGKDNPYGGDPYFALFDEPEGSAGGRLRRKILGLHRATYLGPSVLRYNLCVGKYRAKDAREAAAKLLEKHATDVIVAFGRDVARGFGLSEAEVFTVQIVGQTSVVVLPHPSGLCRLWDTPEAVKRGRELVRSLLPDLPLGEIE